MSPQYHLWPGLITHLDTAHPAFTQGPDPWHKVDWRHPTAPDVRCLLTWLSTKEGLRVQGLEADNPGSHLGAAALEQTMYPSLIRVFLCNYLIKLGDQRDVFQHLAQCLDHSTLRQRSKVTSPPWTSPCFAEEATLDSWHSTFHLICRHSS